MIWSIGGVTVRAGGGTASPYRQPAVQSGERFSRRIAARLALWRERYRSRMALAELDEERLRDIGLTLEDVRRETAKPFWRT